MSSPSTRHTPRATHHAPPATRHPRSANTLVEVLVALVVLAIGLTSVIALFPVGIDRVRNSVLDTRTTLMAQQANETFLLKRMHNDPAIVDFDTYDQAYLKAYGDYFLQNPTNPDVAAAEDTAKATATPILDRYDKNFYAWLPYSPVTYGSGDPRTPGLAQNWSFYLSAEGDRVPFNLNLSPGPNTDDGKVTNASPGFQLSYPVLLDPWLFDHMAIKLNMNANVLAGVPRINISSPLTAGAPTAGFTAFGGYYNLTAGAAFPYGDIPVVSLYEITGFPWSPPGGQANAYQPVAVFERDLLKTRWFTSLSDITFYADRPGEVRNPSAKDYLSAQLAGKPIQPVNYFEPAPIDPVNQNLLSDPNPRATAERNYEFSWAALIQRNLSPDIRDDVVDPNTGAIVTPGTPEVGRPNVESRDFSGRLAIMCFYKRNLDNPYAVIEGCFYNGSRKVTLCWPANFGLNIPPINYGTWLCEMSISRDTDPNSPTRVTTDAIGAFNRHSGVYLKMDGVDLSSPPDGILDGSPVKRQYRRAFAFYKVVEVLSQPEVVSLAGGPRVFVEVMVDRPARGYPLRWAQPAGGLNVSYDGADSRPRDPYNRLPAWPLYDRLDPNLVTNPLAPPSIYSPQFDDETNVSQEQATGVAGFSQYYPVVIFDGLREVFIYEF